MPDFGCLAQTPSCVVWPFDFPDIATKTTAMNIDRIRKKLTGGFRPFIVRTSDGHEYEIPHPEFVAVGRSDIAVVDKEGDINVLDALHIVALKTPKTNGGRARETN